MQKKNPNYACLFSSRKRPFFEAFSLDAIQSLTAVFRFRGERSKKVQASQVSKHDHINLEGVSLKKFLPTKWTVNSKVIVKLCSNSDRPFRTNEGGTCQLHLKTENLFLKNFRWEIFFLFQFHVYSRDCTLLNFYASPALKHALDGKRYWTVADGQCFFFASSGI